MSDKNYTKITPIMEALAQKLMDNNHIDPELYAKYDVKRGLRDINGHGVLAGLTNIANIVAYEEDEKGNSTPIDGVLYYRGYSLYDLVDDFLKDGRYGFEETSYLLLTGELPDAKTLKKFNAALSKHRALPKGFVRDIILEAPSKDIMNAMARAVLTLYTYDDRADDTSVENVMRQSIQLIANFPALAIYAFQACQHYHNNQSLIIHEPAEGLSTAETLLYLLRPDQSYTELEARILDLALVIHADHGGGNNSAFTTRVVTSTGTDTYSAIASALASLKGPKHGGANIKVIDMFKELKSEVSDWTNDAQITAYLEKLLNKEAYDKSGLIYGMGHAVYSLSDPRAGILKRSAQQLAIEKGRTDEFELYSKVETLASDLISKRRKIYKGVSANVDFYSGFVYQMLGLPEELYTPLFSVARISGWSAHRLEELALQNRIIRPAYKCITPVADYKPLSER